PCVPAIAAAERDHHGDRADNRRKNRRRSAHRQHGDHRRADHDDRQPGCRKWREPRLEPQHTRENEPERPQTLTDTDEVNECDGEHQRSLLQFRCGHDELHRPREDKEQGDDNLGRPEQTVDGSGVRARHGWVLRWLRRPWRPRGSSVSLPSPPRRTNGYEIDTPTKIVPQPGSAMAGWRVEIPRLRKDRTKIASSAHNYSPLLPRSAKAGRVDLPHRESDSRAVHPSDVSPSIRQRSDE